MHTEHSGTAYKSELSDNSLLRYGKSFCNSELWRCSSMAQKDSEYSAKIPNITFSFALRPYSHLMHNLSADVY